MRETTKAKILFDNFIKKHESWENQLSCYTNTFRRELMIPILIKMKELERKADE